MLKLTLANGGRVNLLAAHVVMFRPVAEGSEVAMSNGSAYHVQESERSIRGYLNKALFSSDGVDF